ncbi:hypothetical protein GQ53DRAFT_826824 [Thozetella sp. PMI_491]|nr:hypothetical protein GQ53DRAFT_826824 [Thozetella sp. PMI_491]
MACEEAKTDHWSRQETWEEIMAPSPDDSIDYSRPFSPSANPRNSPNVTGDAQFWGIFPAFNTLSNEESSHRLDNLLDDLELANGTALRPQFYDASLEADPRALKECLEKEQMVDRKLALAETRHQGLTEAHPASGSVIHATEPTRVEQRQTKVAEKDGQVAAFTEVRSKHGGHQLQPPVAVVLKPRPGSAASSPGNPNPLIRVSQSCRPHTKSQIRKKTQPGGTKERQNGMKSAEGRRSQSKVNAWSASAARSGTLLVRGGMEAKARGREAKIKWFEAMEKQTDAARYYDNDDKNDGDYED